MIGLSLPQAWAKTDPATQLPAVSVLTHCLNVGAVARGIVERLSPSLQSLFPASTWRGLVCLAALHDIGKISPGFLRKCEAWLRQAAPDTQTARDWNSREKNHARVSHIILGRLYGKPSHAGYAVAAGGHHGRFTCGTHCMPRAASSSEAPSREFKDVDFEAARQELLARLQSEEVFGTLPRDPLRAKEDDATLVVFLTGLITLADWIGSDEAFFELEDPERDNTAATLARATDQAEQALAALRWGEAAPIEGQGFGALFRSADGTAFAPNALQTALAEMVTAGPGLYVVEAPMGCGKTEAALYAGYLRWTRGGERGLYFALPTQLTSDRIYERANAFLAHAIAGPAVSTLVHGSAWLREERAVEVRPAVRDPAPDGDVAHAVDARRWFASGRRALLAPFGAGTLDQALLSVLPAKHCGLRLFALAGKVVVCDEVHSYDPYTSCLLDSLIADLLRLRCTVLVLTATLPAARKAELLAAAGARTVPPETGYPLLTAVSTGSEAAVARVVRADAALARPVRLEHLAEDEPTVWERACEAAEAGACVLVIRNTVARAQGTFRALRCARREKGPAVALLHSQFPRWRRDKLESAWLRRLGKPGRRAKGKKPRPKGCILVSTQVVEQSVDIDADLLITDLAPTDPLLQRIGRLHRHGSNPRPPGFAQPRTWILHPALADTLGAQEIKERLGVSGKIYPPATLFRTWRLWRGRAEVHLPEDIRPLLDATYAPRADDAPAGMRVLDEELKARVTKRIDTAKARQDRLEGLSKEDRDDGSLTRWRERETADLLLLRERPCRETNGEWRIALLDGSSVRVNPYQWRLPVAQALHRNVVRVPRYAVQDWLPGTPPYLRDYFEGGNAVGVVVGEEVRPLLEVETKCQGSWNAEEGISVQAVGDSRGANGHFADMEDEDDW